MALPALSSGTISEQAGGSVTLVGSTIAVPGTLDTQGGSVSVESPLPGFTVNNSFTVSGNIQTQGGAVNVFLADAVGVGDSFTVSGGIYTGGGNVTVDADTIAMNTQSGAAIISTRDLAASPGNPASGPFRGQLGRYLPDRHQHHAGQCQRSGRQREPVRPSRSEQPVHGGHESILTASRDGRGRQRQRLQFPRCCRKSISRKPASR